MAKRLERGAVTEAEKSYGYPSGTIEKYIKRHSKQKKGYEYWVDHVNEMFDITLSLVQGQSAVSNHSNSASSGFSDNATPESSVLTTPSYPKEIFTSHQNLEHTRTFTAHINQIIRKDLESRIKGHFINVLNNAQVDISDYICNYGFKVFNMLLLLCSHKFLTNANGGISLQETKGELIRNVLPSSFTLDNSSERLPPHLSADCIQSEDFEKYYKNLFTQSHLQIIHSTYFGPRGSKPETLCKNPAIKAFVDVMPPDTNERSTIDSYLMQKAQSQYATNFQNLCTSPGCFRNILHKLLNDLLRIHLAPERNRKYTKYVKQVKETLETKKSEEQASQLPRTTHSRIQLANKSRNLRRNLFKTERSCRDKMLKKYAESGYKENKWKEKADRCDLRIQTYERILREEVKEYNTRFSKLLAITDLVSTERREQEASEQQLVHQESDGSDDMLDFTNRSEELHANEERALELEDTETDITNDLPRRRINVLVAIIKAVLYEHPQELILSSHFQEKASEIDEREMKVCLQIANIVSPYFPLPNHRKLFQYTIPFILMANKIFHAIGLSRRMISICPLTNPGRLISLHVDAPSLFSLLCGTTVKDKPMNVYDFDGQIIATRMIATEQKDAMFASFFDLQKIYTMCNSWKHTFGYYIVVLPGTNTIRITNKLNNYPSQQSCKKLPVKEKINQEDPSPSHQQFGTKPSPESLLPSSQQQESLLNLTQEIEAQVQEIKRRLKYAYNERKGEILAKNVNKLKAKWSSPNKTYLSKAARVAQNKARGNTEIYDQIKIAKTRKRALYKAVQEAKSQLRMLRHRMYLMKKKDKRNLTKSPTNLITEESYKCFEKVDDLTIDTYLLEKPNKVTFSGTDNGLVTLSEAVGFDMRKLRFHLDL